MLHMNNIVLCESNGNKPEPGQIKAKCIDCGSEFYTFPEAIWAEDVITRKPAYKCMSCIIYDESISDDIGLQDIENCTWEEEE